MVVTVVRVEGLVEYRLSVVVEDGEEVLVGVKVALEVSEGEGALGDEGLSKERREAWVMLFPVEDFFEEGVEVVGVCVRFEELEYAVVMVAEVRVVGGRVRMAFRVSLLVLPLFVVEERDEALEGEEETVGCVGGEGVEVVWKESLNVGGAKVERLVGLKIEEGEALY